MKILHLSDFHFSNKGAKSIQKQKDLCKNILEKVRDLDFNYIFFSGDLVNNGENKSWFEIAHKMLISPILLEKNKTLNEVFYCQGNHDVDWSLMRSSQMKFINEELINNDLLDNYAVLGNRDFDDSLEKSQNYFNFIKSLDFPENDEINEMYTAHIRNIDGLEIGIVSINTAWHSYQDDENNLLFPIELLNQAYEKISGTHKKILIHHHPLNFLKTFNQYELEDVIHNKFDITFFGHVHKGLLSIDSTPKTGVIKILSPAALKKHEGGEIGFSLVEFNFDVSEFSIQTFLYDERHNFFYNLPEIKKYEIPESEEIKKQNSFRKTVRKLLEHELDLAKDLIVSFDRKDLSFLDIFVDPVLKRASSDEEINLKNYDARKIELDSEDYIISGDDKCGKTSFLKKVHIDLLSNYDKGEIIPFFMDFKLQKNTLTEDNFVDKFKRYYELNKKRADEILATKTLFLTIDNFESPEFWQINFLENLKKKYPESKFVIATSLSPDLLYIQHKFENFSPIVIKFENLRKKQIRELTKKWTVQNSQGTEEIVTKINSIFRQLNIPYNFWSVSLFLWVLKKNGERSIQNNSGLVSLYIESLLERENLIKSNASFAYEKYIDLLSHLAYYLLKHYGDTVYCAPELIILSFIETHLERNPRNKKVSSTAVWNYLKERKIFKEVDDGFFSFRLNGVFEYFLANYMKIEPSFLQDVLKDQNVYLSFKNEFELYAGLVRNDERFLKEIYYKTKEVFTKMESKYDQKPIDDNLKNLINILPNYERKILELSSKARSLTYDEQDKFDQLASEFDLDSEIIEGVKRKEPIVVNKENVRHLGDSLFILGRVFRNSDEIYSLKLIEEIFSFFLKSTCYWGFRLIETSKLIDFESNYKNDLDVDFLYQLLSKFMPLIIQTSADEFINQKNMEGIIQDRIQLLKSDNSQHSNQLELFVLYFLLVDIDLKQNLNRVSEISEIITIPILRFSLILKLSKYLSFNTNDDPELEQSLKNLIQKEKIKMDKGTKLGDIHKNFSKNKKDNLLRRNS